MRIYYSICLLSLASLTLGECSNGPLRTESRASAALARAREVIATHRQGDAVIRVVTPDGRALSEVRLEINQVSHEFQFGCYLDLRELPRDRSESYAARFGHLFNRATIGAYWGVLERSTDRSAVANEVEWNNGGRDVPNARLLRRLRSRSGGA